jgi:hypothetical protein
VHLIQERLLLRLLQRLVPVVRQGLKQVLLPRLRNLQQVQAVLP